MAESEQRNKENCIVGSKEMMVKQEKRENTLTNGGKGSGDDADSLEELPLDIGEHYLVRRSDDSWRKYIQQKLFKLDIMRVKAIMNIMFIMKDIIEDWMNGCLGIELCQVDLI